MSDIIFQKSLQDMINGIRAHKLQSSDFISQEMTSIKTELKSADTFTKAEAIRKLTYLQMIGYNVSWAAFAVVEVMSFSRFAHKRIGYLAANQTFNDSTDLILLTTNLYKKELLSSNMGSSQYEVGLALNSLSNIVTSELGRDCLSDIIGLVNHSIPYLRKRAVLTLYKLYIKYPAGLRLTFDLIKDRLDDSDSSVVSTAVSVICELANRNPANYLALAPKFFKLLTTSSNNWLLIKLVKLFGLLVSEEPRLARKLIDPLVTLILNNAAKSLQFECINTLTTAYLYTKKEDGTDAKNVPNAVKVCSDHLRIFITDTDQNLKYLGLVGLVNLMRSHPRVVVEHRDIVLQCLHDADVTIRTKALELLAGIVSKKSLMDIVKHLMQHVATNQGEYRDQVVATILQICSKEKYALVIDFPWYVSILVRLLTLEGSREGQTVAAHLVDVALRVKDVRAYVVHSMLPYFLDRSLVQERARSDVDRVVRAAGWLITEYSVMLPLLSGALSSEDTDDGGFYWMDGPEGVDIRSEFKARDLLVDSFARLLHPQNLLLSEQTQAVFVHGAMKIFVRAALDSPKDVATILSIFRIRIDPFQHSLSVEIMERASSFRSLLTSLNILPQNWQAGMASLSRDTDASIANRSSVQSIDEQAASRVFSVKHLLTALVAEQFYVVSSKAQRRVPAPTGISLNDRIDSSAMERIMKANTIPHASAAHLSHQLSFLASRKMLANEPSTSYASNYSASSNYTEGNEIEVKYKPTEHVSFAVQAPLERKDNLFYLRSVASIADVTPLSKVLLETFEDPVTLSGTGKKSKKSKRDKRTKAVVDTTEMLPAGAASSDEDEDRANGRRGHKKGGREGLDSVDITTPLRPDEVIPVQTHRQSTLSPYELSKSHDKKDDKKKSRKDKDKSRSKTKDESTSESVVKVVPSELPEHYEMPVRESGKEKKKKSSSKREKGGKSSSRGQAIDDLLGLES